MILSPIHSQACVGRVSRVEKHALPCATNIVDDGRIDRDGTLHDRYIPEISGVLPFNLSDFILGLHVLTGFCDLLDLATFHQVLRFVGPQLLFRRHSQDRVGSGGFPDGNRKLRMERGKCNHPNYDILVVCLAEGLQDHLCVVLKEYAAAKQRIFRLKMVARHRRMRRQDRERQNQTSYSHTAPIRLTPPLTCGTRTKPPSAPVPPARRQVQWVVRPGVIHANRRARPCRSFRLSTHIGSPMSRNAQKVSLDGWQQSSCYCSRLRTYQACQCRRSRGLHGLPSLLSRVSNHLNRWVWPL